MAECGICGSDLHLVFDGYVRPGAILGHEWSGTVVSAAGAGPGWSGGRAGRLQPDAGVRPVPTVPAGPAVGLPVPRVLRHAGHAGCLRPVRDRVRRQRPAYPRLAHHPGGGAGRTDRHRPPRRRAGRRGNRRPRPDHRRRPGRTDHPGRAPGPGRDRHHGQRTGGRPCATGPGRRGGPHRRPRGSRRTGAGRRRLRVLRRGLRVLRSGRRRPGCSGSAGLRRHPGLRRHRIRAHAGEPQPDDHPRARGGGRLQLQRRRLPTRARPAGQR